MNLRQMEVFRAVVLTGGVGPAAELLHVSQPAVSKVLALAARYAGFALFERIKGRLVVTPEGQQLYEEIDGLWRGVERVRQVTRNLGEAGGGTLRLAVSASIAPYLAPQAMALLYEQFPHLKSHMEILVPPILESALLDRSIDIAVALQPNAHPSLETMRSYRCDLVCVMHESHPLARKTLIRVADLREERLIGLSPDTPYGQIIDSAYGARKRALRFDLEVRSSTMACWYAQARAGVAVVERAAVAGPSFEGLAVRRFQSPKHLEIEVLRNRYRPMSLVERAFCDAFDTTWQETMGVQAKRQRARSRGA